MAIGIKPGYENKLAIGDLTREQFLVIALETVQQLQWPISYFGIDGILARTGIATLPNESVVIIRFGEDGITLKSLSVANELWDRGRNKKNIANFLEVFNEKKLTLTDEERMARYQYLESINAIRTDHYLTTLEKDTSTSILPLFIPARNYFITPMLIDANILVFLLMAVTGVSIMEPDSTSLLAWGANFRPLTLDGQWWRLITNCFLHIGLIHLLMNMYALFFIGLLLEPHLGRLKFLSAYLVTGIAASTVSLWWHTLTISAGASGAIFGMYGVFLALLTGNVIEKKTRRAQLVSIIFFVGYNLLYGMKSGIDNAAHTGGLISGLFMGYAYMPALKKPNPKGHWKPVILISVVVLAAVVALFRSIPGDVIEYSRLMKTFDVNERQALTVYSSPSGTPNEQLINEATNGVLIWKEELVLLARIEKLHLPTDMLQRNEMLKRYCALRLESYNMLIAYFRNSSVNSKKAIDTFNLKIQAVIDSLNADHKAQQDP